MFLKACKQLGLTEPQLFNVEDLYSGSKIRSVAVTIHWLAYVANQMNLDLPPFDPMHLSRISLPADQKQTLQVKKPRASQYNATPTPTPAATTTAPLQPSAASSLPVPPPSDPTPPVPAAAEPKRKTIDEELQDFDKMLADLETDSNRNPVATPVVTPAPSSVTPDNYTADATPSTPTRLQASLRTPDSPVMSRDKPPRWSDANNTPDRQAQSRASTGAGNLPVWQDRQMKDPNITNCDDCRCEIMLGETAYSHGNGTYCRGCLCGTCGNPFQGKRKHPDAGRNYCPDCVCRRCAAPITSQYVLDGNRKVCLNCACTFCRAPLGDTDLPPLCNNCKCSQCQGPLNGKYFPTDEGGRNCETCHQNNVQRKVAPAPAPAPTSNSASRGAAADNRSSNNGYQRKLCAKCGQPLSGNVLECNNKEYHASCFKCVDCGSEGVHLLAGEPYCADCHPDKECCCVCGSSLRGGGLEALGRLYHEKCFTCQRCFNPLPGGKFKEIDNFALCNNCAAEIVNSNISHA